MTAHRSNFSEVSQSWSAHIFKQTLWGDITYVDRSGQIAKYLTFVLRQQRVVTFKNHFLPCRFEVLGIFDLHFIWKQLWIPEVAFSTRYHEETSQMSSLAVSWKNVALTASNLRLRACKGSFHSQFNIKYNCSNAFIH